jgi:GDPmannose 4,6-dehydratase
MAPLRNVALIFGISGQDGAYLSRFLLDRGYAVHGTSRDKEMSGFPNLHRLNIHSRVLLHSAAVHDFRSVVQVIGQIKPTEIYNLAAQSSVGLSFDQPVETIESILSGTLNVLEAIRFLKFDTKFYNASTSECFGNTGPTPADENTAFKPCSPYGVAKAAAYWLVSNYRQSYNVFASSGILFNHESPLRPSRFVTQKIVRGAIDVAQKKAKVLELGNLRIIRDWGWAPEYVEAMWRMLQQVKPEDFVVATGVSSTLETFVAQAFAHLNLDWQQYVRIREDFLRTSDISVSAGNPAKAERLLGWKATTAMPHLVSRLIEGELERRGIEIQNENVPSVISRSR